MHVKLRKLHFPWRQVAIINLNCQFLGFSMEPTWAKFSLSTLFSVIISLIEFYNVPVPVIVCINYYC